MAATDWLHVSDNPTGAVGGNTGGTRRGLFNTRFAGVGGGYRPAESLWGDSQVQPLQTPIVPLQVGAMDQQAQPMGGQNIWAAPQRGGGGGVVQRGGGGGGWGGFGQMGLQERRDRGLLVGNPGGVMSAPSPNALTANGRSSGLGEFYKRQNTPSEFDVMQGQMAEDKAYASKGWNARMHLRADQWGAAHPNAAPLFPSFADGTEDSGPSPIIANVGEEGPEQVILPPHSAVIPNDQVDDWSSALFAQQMSQPRVFAAPGDIPPAGNPVVQPAPVSFEPFRKQPAPTFGEQLDSRIVRHGEIDPNPLSPFESATTPQAMKQFQHRVMSTDAGKAWFVGAKNKQAFDLASGQMEAQKANNANFEKRMNREATTDRLKFTQDAIDARTAFTTKAAADRQKAGFENQTKVHAENERKKKEMDEDIYDSHADILADEVKSGKMSADDASALLKIPDHKIRQAELTRRRDEAANKNNVPKVHWRKKINDDGTTEDVAHYMELDENGKPYLVPVPIGKPAAASAVQESPSINDKISGALKK